MPHTGLNITVASRRLKSLDVLRAIAILLMIFSGLLPKTLPNWMDHGYNPHFLPDASGQWSLRAGIADGSLKSLFLRDWNGRPWASFTWVDLVFPMFLFAMGAAIPIALSRSNDGNPPTRSSLIASILKRFVTLIIFAGLVYHLSPAFMYSVFSPNGGRLAVVAAFLLAMLFFVRWPTGTPTSVTRTIRTTALAGMFALIVGYVVRNDITFQWKRADVIILVLAQTYLVASLIWLVSRRHATARFVVLIPLLLLAHYLQFAPAELSARRWLGNAPIDIIAPITSGIEWVLNLTHWLVPKSDIEAWQKYVVPIFDLSPLWDFSWYKYLFVVIPGTMVGDWLRAWNERGSVGASPFAQDASAPRVNRYLLASTLLLCAALLVGLRHSGYPFLGIGGPLRTPWLGLVLGLPALALLAWTVLPTAYGSLWILRKMFYFGSGFLLVGLILACWPNSATAYFEGGASKGPPATISYYLISVGLCTLLLMTLVALLDYNRSYGLVTSLLEANGQNALLAYFLAHAVLGAVMSLTVLDLFGRPYGPDIASIDDLIMGYYLNNHEWFGAVWAATKTLLIAGIVWIFSLNRIFWRA